MNQSLIRPYSSIDVSTGLGGSSTSINLNSPLNISYKLEQEILNFQKIDDKKSLLDYFPQND
jgi:hypothetical protein